MPIGSEVIIRRNCPQITQITQKTKRQLSLARGERRQLVHHPDKQKDEAGISRFVDRIFLNLWNLCNLRINQWWFFPAVCLLLPAYWSFCITTGFDLPARSRPSSPQSVQILAGLRRQKSFPDCPSLQHISGQRSLTPHLRPTSYCNLRDISSNQV